VWRFDLDGQAASPSVDNQGRIYVNTRVSTYAIKPDGTLGWRFPKPGTTSPEYTSVSIGWNGLLFRSPTLEVLQAVDYAGQLLWEFRLRDLEPNVKLIEASPVLDRRNHAYLGAAIPATQKGLNFFALTEGGEVKFATSLSNPVSGLTGSVVTPSIGRTGQAYAVTDGEALFCIR
jgi:hypothetical protein